MFKNFAVWEPIPVQNLSVSLGVLASQLDLYSDSSFAQQRVNSVFQSTERAYIKHSLLGDDVDTLTLLVEKVWLSNSSDPSADALHDLTSNLQMHQQVAATAHFSVSLVTCNNCYLHSRSTVQQYSQTPGRRLSVSDRRLAMSEDVAAQYLVIQVLDTNEDPQFVQTSFVTSFDWSMLLSLGLPVLLGNLIALGLFLRHKAQWKYSSSSAPLAQANLQMDHDQVLRDELQSLLDGSDLHGPGEEGDLDSSRRYALLFRDQTVTPLSLKKMHAVSSSFHVFLCQVSS